MDKDNSASQGQQRALRELARLQAAAPDKFTIIGSPQLIGNNLVVEISLLLGLIESKKGGLPLYERENFIVVIPPDFPFDVPWIKVSHNRFAGFPHVIWSKQLCLYQSKIEWNPADGLYGFFDRLVKWLGQAAVNDMDPEGGPLEPPHHITDVSQLPFVIRKNAPVEVGKQWFGLAELEKYPNRIELVNWNNLEGDWPEGKNLALAIFLSKPLPMEFPQNGDDFFNELSKQEIDSKQIIRNLALASLFAKKGEPIHLILGIPMMRRSPDGTPKHHIAVWTTDTLFWDVLRETLPEDSDSKSIQSLKDEFAEKIFSIIRDGKIVWCRVFEDRREIIIRRDKGSPIEWLANKKVLILGCGALGSWVAEIVARAEPQFIHLVDNGKVNPGLLARQNYRQEDIGSNKASALTIRIRSIVTPGVVVQGFDEEAHKFIFSDLNRFRDYDIAVDCTASHIFQMKLERDWDVLKSINPFLVSMIIDARAHCSLVIALGQKSFGGIWDAYVNFKYRLSSDGGRPDLMSAFYADRAVKGLFQPEPGCSDPTFSGSTSDIFALVSVALNSAIEHIKSFKFPVGIGFSVHDISGSGNQTIFNLPKLTEVRVGQYRVRVRGNLFCEAKAWVRQNNRLRSCQHETGGLLWGHWDDAINVIWLFDLSGPPSDSRHEPGYFLCGIEGTINEHKCRFKQSEGICGFIGHWHTHPQMLSRQSSIDMSSMATLVSTVGHNQKKVMMLIFGRASGRPSAGMYVYESLSNDQNSELISVGEAQVELETAVV